MVNSIITKDNTKKDDNYIVVKMDIDSNYYENKMTEFYACTDNLKCNEYFVVRNMEGDLIEDYSISFTCPFTAASPLLNFVSENEFDMSYDLRTLSRTEN